MERIFLPLECKAHDENENVVTGHGAAFNNVDSYGDVILGGAFKKTIRDRLKRGRIKLMSAHGYSNHDVLGTVTVAREDEKGLYFEANISRAPSAQDTKIKMLEGHIDMVSIGFSTVRDHYGLEKNGENPSLRFLDELKLYEISPLVFPANEEAEIISVKSMVPFLDLPIADVGYKWDAKAAEQRVRERGNITDEPMFFYRKAFMYYDRDNPLEFDSYKLQIADVIDGKLTVIPEAVKLTAQALHNERSSIDVPNVHDVKIKSHIEQYCEKMDGWFTPTWKKSGYDLIQDITGIVTPEEKRIIEVCKGLIATDPEHAENILKALSEKAEPDSTPLTDDDKKTDELARRESDELISKAMLGMADTPIYGVG